MGSADPSCAAGVGPVGPVVRTIGSVTQTGCISSLGSFSAELSQYDRVRFAHHAIATTSVRDRGQFHHPRNGLHSSTTSVPRTTL